MLQNREDLQNTRTVYKKRLDQQKKKILICAGTACVASGSLAIYDEFIRLANEKGIPCSIDLQHESEEGEVGIKKSGCHGFCEMGPLVRIDPKGYLYVKVHPSDCLENLETSIINDNCVERLIYQKGGEMHKHQESIPFYSLQKRVVLENCGRLDATSIGEYLAMDGYSALEQALFEMTPEEVLNEVEISNLRAAAASLPRAIGPR